MPASTPTEPDAAGRRERAVRAGVAYLAALSLALGVWMTVAPASFHDALGPFGPDNDHYLRDMATWQLAFGGALLAAVWRPSWRRPLIAVGAAQALLHTVNHVADAGEADPGWVGAFDVVTLALQLGLFAWLWHAAGDDRPTAGTAERHAAAGGAGR